MIFVAAIRSASLYRAASHRSNDSSNFSIWAEGPRQSALGLTIQGLTLRSNHPEWSMYIVARWRDSLKASDEIYRIKRDAVLRESGRIFSRRGFHNTSLDDVAKALDVSKGTLYNYVQDKQEILFECHNMALDIAERALSQPFNVSASSREKLTAILVRYISSINDELGACGVITETQSLRPKDRETVLSRRRKFEKRFVALVEQGIVDGSLRAVDPKLAVLTFLGAIHAIPLWYDPKGRLSSNEIAQKMVAIVMEGLSEPSGKPKQVPDQSDSVKRRGPRRQAS